jgi:uncharacterized phage protein gp47/JayE
MSLTASGWVSRRYPEIFASLQTALRNTIHPDLDVSSTSVAGQVAAIFAAEIARQEALGQAVYDSGNRDKAEGKNLDDLAALIGITRNTASASSGVLLLSGSNATTVPAGSLFKTSDNKYTISSATTTDLTTSLCQSVEVTVATVANSTVYTVAVNGNSFSHTSSASATISSILNGLNSTITSFLASNPTAGFTSSTDGVKLIVASTEKRNDISIALGARLGTDKVIAAVTGRVTENGRVAILPGTVTQIVTPVLGLNTVSNPFEFQYGRAVETDEELRIRMSTSVEIAGKATVPAIRAALANITGVSSTSVQENAKPNPSADGLPPHSYRIIIEGGDDQEIANTVWETKPAGIQTFTRSDGLGGSLDGHIVSDAEGNPQVVHFMRPIPKYIHLSVEVTLYNEEIYPSATAEAAVKEALVAYGAELGVGKDVICKRFYGAVYGAVNGVSNVSILASYTEDPLDIPDPNSFVEVLPVGSIEVSRFDVSRISYNIVS